MAKELSEEEKLEIKNMIDNLVARAKKASEEYLKLDQETVNNVIKAMSMAGLAKATEKQVVTYAIDGEQAGTKMVEETATKLISSFQADSATTKIDAKGFASLNAFIKSALQTVSKQRSDLGAVQNRLEHTIKNLDNIVENTTAAESQIRDTDMATEMVKYSNNNILTQAGQAMLAQANQSNQGVLSLLG